MTFSSIMRAQVHLQSHSWPRIIQSYNQRLILILILQDQTIFHLHHEFLAIDCSFFILKRVCEWGVSTVRYI